MDSMSREGVVSQTIDLDLIVKVLSNTVLSPFFAIWVPIFYKSQGLPWSSPIIFYSSLYVGLVLAFRAGLWLDHRWSNGLLKSVHRLDWSSQVVVVTGGSSGIGLLLANTLAMRGVVVAVLDIVPLGSDQGNIEYYKCDVSNWAEVEKCAAQIAAELGPPTILVNNAGVVQGKLLVDLSEADVLQTFGVNTLAHFWTLKAFLPHMIKNKSGHIVTTSSLMGLVGAGQMSDYCASKSAAINLHESLRYELNHRYNAPDVRTTLVLPGYTDTQMFSRSSYREALRSSYLYRFCIPPVRPQDIVKAIIATLDAQESRKIILPFYGNFVGPMTRILPSWGRDFLQWLSNADFMMEGFVKVSGLRPDEQVKRA